MAKLIDILARELKVWPESWGIFCVATKVEGNDAAWFNYRNPVFKDGGWQDLGSVELWLSQEPEDRKEVVVRRFEWQAAVDALNAPKVVEWDGVGLPPVGTVCEHFGTADHTNWIEVQIIGHGNIRHHDVAFFEYMAGTNGYTVSYSTANNFRKPRTAEQVASDNRDKAAESLYRAVMDHSQTYWPSLQEHRKEHYRRLIDDGWCKIPK